MAEKARLIGIDLGTTNTCVASVRNKIPKVVPTDKGSLILPSVVSLSAKGALLVGNAARDQLLINPLNTIYGAKRLIGRKYDSRVVEELKSHFSYDIVEGPNGDTAVRLGDRTYSLPEISSLILSHVKAIAEQFLGGPIDGAVISVPAYYNDNQRNAVKEAGRLAGINVRRIVNEPTAAALAYGFKRGLSQKLLVYDMGGGTFDVSVLQLHGNVYEVLATGGDTFLGGIDFDNCITQYVLETFRKETKIDLSKNAVAMQRIHTAAEAAKIDLTLMPNVVIELPYIDELKGQPVDLRVSLTRVLLEQLTQPLVEKSFAICDRVLKERGLSRSNIDEVILVGGQSRMPLIQQQIATQFGKAPRKGVHPDECVALGAALLADSLDQIDAVTLLDALSMPIGFAAGQGKMRKIIEKNSVIPLTKSFRLPPPQVAHQPFIEMDLFQGDSESIVDNEYLGTLKVASALVGRKIDFKLNEECLLKVQVETASGPREVTLATRDTPLSLKQALAAEYERRAMSQPQEEKEVLAKGGLLSTIKRALGGSR